MIRDGKGTPKKSCNKDFAELSGEFSAAICLKTLVLLDSASNCSENYLVLFVRCFGIGVLSWPLELGPAKTYILGDRQRTCAIKTWGL